MHEETLYSLDQAFTRMIVVSNRLSPQILLCCRSQGHLVYVSRKLFVKDPHLFDDCPLC